MYYHVEIITFIDDFLMLMIWPSLSHIAIVCVAAMITTNKLTEKDRSRLIGFAPLFVCFFISSLYSLLLPPLTI